MTFEGSPDLQHRHDVERDGLPTPVRGGTTYRDVTVRTTISTTLADPLDAAVDATSEPSPPEDRP